ncbi:MAG: Gfo/Idh/MocA family oxidoreductase [Melioribacteraceae bacterium]|nr:Gfo/Idh/MocA family oxidoreductase [Melioribacteraceae bacterium]
MNEYFNQNRREFLKRISILAGSSIAVTTMPWLKVFADSKSFGKSAADKVRLGIIGIGDRGSALLLNVKSFMNSLNVDIAAICDNYEPNFHRALERTEGKAEGFRDYRKLLEIKDLDGIIIATPLNEHAHITIDALNSGLHVFCEKAMARSIEDVKLMYDTHIKADRILQIGLQRMFNPVYLEGIEKIHKGELGQITQMRAYWHRNNNWRRPVPDNNPELEKKINWRLYDNASAGLLTELASHQIQIANWVKNSEPVSVMGTGSINYWKDGREVFDNIACIFSYADGTQFIYDSVSSNKHYGLEEQIMGHKGTIEFEINKMYSESPPNPPAILRLVNDIEKGIFDTIPIGGASWITETASQYNGEYISNNYKMDETKLQLEAFVKYIRKGRAPEILTMHGYHSSLWCLLAENAIKQGSVIKLPIGYSI